MGLFSSEGVVIRVRTQRERDRLVTVFTPDRGRMNLLAPGALRPGSRFGSAMELGATFAFDAFQSQPDSLPRLSAAKTTRPLVRPRSDLRAFAHLSLLLEFVAELAAGSEPEPVYRELGVELARLESDGDNEVALLGFLLRLLRHAGHEPETRVCVRCRKTFTAAGWAPNEGGLIGRCCVPDTPLLAAEVITALRGGTTTRAAATTAMVMLVPFVRRHLDHDLRAWPFWLARDETGVTPVAP